MQSFKLYGAMAIKDVFRLWSATQIQIVIISGICLPILILLGLKNGHVADLRKELATSPTGRQVLFWSAQGGDLISQSVTDDILTAVPNAELIIPESQRLVFAISRRAQERNLDASDTDDPIEKQPITLYSTLPGDPLLEQYGIHAIDSSSRDVVLSESVANSLGVSVGDPIKVEINRRLGDVRESHELTFKLAGILATNDEGEGQATGYAHLDTMRLFERYGTGAAVESWEIPAMEGRAAVDLYETMVLFCFRGQRTDLSTNDHEFLASRGLRATEVKDRNLRLLYGALKEESLEKLRAYLIERLDRDSEVLAAIQDNPQLIVRNTEAEDDMIVRWSEPIRRSIDGEKYNLVGLTLPTKRETGGWINTFLHENAPRFTYEETLANPFAVRFINGGPALESISKLSISEGIEVPLQVGSDAAPGNSTEKVATSDASNAPSESSGQNDELPVAIVPVNLLAYLHQLETGMIQFDSSGRRFVDIPSELDFTKARLYTRTIDDVPEAVSYLASRQYAVLSESSRIAEIHQQDQSLQMLVFVVALGVFGFGVVTVFSVLVDSTDRKKGTIGILRVMGMSRFGVFIVVLFRAFVIGLLAAILCVVVGYGLAAFLRAEGPDESLLSWKPVISVVLSPADVGLIALGALLCASLGAVLPALKASALDPFDAITEGQFG